MAEELGEKGRQGVAARAERSDSIRNREKLTAAAQAVFAAEGLNAPMDRIAATAGVGPGTLYRHFPSRLKLWEAVLEEPLRGQLAVARNALANPDRWEGLAEYIVASCEIEAERDGYLNLMNTRFDGAPGLQAIRAEIQRTVRRLVTLARDEGAVRPDFTMEDLLFIAVSNSKIAEVTRSTAPGAWRRNVELFLDAIRPERAHPLSQRPLTPSQVARSMVRQESLTRP
ncbi:TetR/AcrR family transcriptional regulator [Leifsonia sp. NPDC058230]|uniref:TetR/AcrR family transcriptional regulator n=1 Tax=Leifsonia sp. NPDC058230 TaxID=3346391 RepID=UPI0036DDA899